MEDRYEPQTFESRWAEDWNARRIYAAPELPGEKPKRFVMEMFPYPSGDLHVGHVENYSIADAMARYWRMKGFEVMHPMGYDAFGLPAERRAMQLGIHPREATITNINQMRSSFLRLGFSYDWDREVISCEPEYYRWNQWIFLKLLDNGLAYRTKAAVNWCPVDKTVLAKEQVVNGSCWRCGSEPVVRDLTQWFLRITNYSDRLLDDMPRLRWKDSLLAKQRHWIGRSRGAEVTFVLKTKDGKKTIEMPVFTTRPDTLWGATFFVVAAEHPSARDLVEGSGQEKDFDDFVRRVRQQTEVDRMAGTGARLGAELPAVAINPVSGEEIPVWAADYVLMGYGTGAIMAVPAHDQRDFEFARQYKIPIKPVIAPDDQPFDEGTVLEAPYSGPGRMIHSGPFDGTRVDPETREGIDKVIDWLQSEGKGSGAINYRQRDWLVSRQRYWGTPIPIIHCEDCGEVPVPYEQLPVVLPDQADYTPKEDAVSPLAKNEEWVNVACPSCGKGAKRETDTLDTFFDSAWYFLRYCDPKNEEIPFDASKANAWGPVDFYFGGEEHAVTHLIFARFFTKFFADQGWLNFEEPFETLFNQGYVTLVGKDMSKSSGHIIEAAGTIDRFGADAARVFMLFCSPPADDYDFDADGQDEIGRVAFRWLSRVWRVMGEVSDHPPSDELSRVLHRTVKAVTEDMEVFGLNTAIASLMTFVNEVTKSVGPPPKQAAETFLKLLAPFAPFITEELWHRYGNEGSIHFEQWPDYDEKLASPEQVTLVLQVNGKVRDKVQVTPDINEEDMRELALSNEKVRSHLDGAEPKKIVVVPPRLVNVVV
ncbi:MAG TPA: leucine--tRNA ligase [Actinomycetota bacterium]|nr:leucine--tRNA ligase [Actinomycetota bacterium]